MDQLARCGMGVGVLMAVLGSLSFLQGPVIELSTLHGDLVGQEEREARLEEQLEEIARRREAKLQVLAELAEQRLTLQEAAARFRTINATMPENIRELVEQVYPANSEEERYCRVVIAAMNYLPPRNSYINEVTLTRLKEEFERYRRQGLFPRSRKGKPVSRADRL